MKKSIFILSAFAALVVTFVACDPQSSQPTEWIPKLPATPYDYSMVNMSGQTIKTADLIHDESAPYYNNASVALGRVLFYDRSLSINNTTSCSSCHKQSMAFSDQMALSDGFGGKKTLRNSMGIQNVVLNNNMFWDSRDPSPFEMSLKPIFNHIEMGILTDEMLIERVNSKSYYAPLFQEAFGNAEVSKKKIALAISSFLNACFSQNSKFDQGLNNNFVNYTEMEKMGKDIFFSNQFKCSECHAGSNFMAPDDPNMGGAYSSPEVKGTANIGLDLSNGDKGKSNGEFKIPSLRNIALTAPYMHDGRFATLNDVLEHYSHNINASTTLDTKLKNGNGKPIKMNFTQLEKDALIAFLNTLTDESLITDPRFSDPFVKK